jgi:crotonobetainyl-CoA:carnitine CoA-transferase CaiB-like acyl-CoA transferase
VDRGLIAYSDHPTEGRIPHLVNPRARSGLAAAPYREAPELGADGDSVLSELGYSEAEQQSLRKSGAVS